MSYGDPPAAAVANGHDLLPDPPAALTRALRWTCRRCGATALRYESNEYGSATTDACPEAVPA